MSYYKEKADQTSDTHTYTDGIDTLGDEPRYLGLRWACLSRCTAARALFIEPFGVPSRMLGLPWREAMYNHGEFEALAAFGDVIWH